MASEQDIRQWSPLHEAATNGRIEVVRFILSENGADIHAEDDYGRTAFELAACSGHVAIVKELLSRGAVYRETYFRSVTTLQQVAGVGYEEILQLMIEAGADVNAPAAVDDNGYTALCAAAKGGHEGVVEILLGAGADPNIQNKDGGGCTALQAAAKEGHKAVVEGLLTAGADVDASICDDSPLQAAATAGHSVIVEMLLGAGADVHADGDAALAAAMKAGQEAVIVILLKEGAKENTPMR